jgi:topoisomerase-4 subunit A
MGNLNELPDDAILISDSAEIDYLTYAVMSVKERALPQVEDGQKPVQKRILYSMWSGGQRPDVKHVKSARVVGDVLGKLHPHGDTSVYDAMVRLAQGFTVRYPLMDGQGNFGSLDGDTAAAMRYTEIRLSPIAELLLSEVHSGTVDFIDNYDGSFKEPKVLPARLPFTLLNGASGIAVGMACEVPSHNLREVAKAVVEFMRNPSITTGELMQHVPGPDFPGGGKLISSATDIQNAYETGSGSLRARAQYEIEELARGQWQLVFTEFPPGCSAKKVLQELDAIADPKVKDIKKDKPTAKQLAAKQLILSMIDTARDESDKSKAVRLVVEPRTSKIKPGELLAFLFAQTSLESSVSVNLTVVGVDGNPARKNLKQIVSEWVEFRFATVTRRCQHKLQEVNERLHILEGRKIAFLHLDKVIRVIRESDEPKAALMQNFKLTEVQAQDILEIRLRQLARLEWIKLEKEIETLTPEKAELERLLSSNTAMRKLIIKEVEADAKKFGDARRTVIVEEVPSASSTAAPVVADEPVTVILSKNGWVRGRTGHDIDLSQVGFKPGDELLAVVETRTVLPVICLDNNGRAYSFLAAEAPTGRGDGVPVTSLVDLQDGGKIRFMLGGNPQKKFLFAGTNGYGFVTTLNNLASRPRAGKAFLTLESGEVPLPPLALPEDMAGMWIGCGSSNGRFLAFAADELKELAKGKGVKLIGLEKDAKVCRLLIFTGEQLPMEIVVRNRVMKFTLAREELDKHRAHRASKGSFLPKKAVLNC